MVDQGEDNGFGGFVRQSGSCRLQSPMGVSGGGAFCPPGVLPDDWLLGFPSFLPFCIFIKVAALDVTCCTGTPGHTSDVVLLRLT